MADDTADPRYRPGAPDLHDLAQKAVHGHQMVADAVRHHAHGQAAELEARRAGPSPGGDGTGSTAGQDHDGTPATG